MHTNNCHYQALIQGNPKAPPVPIEEKTFKIRPEVARDCSWEKDTSQRTPRLTEVTELRRYYYPLRKVLGVKYVEWGWRGRPAQPEASDTGKQTLNTTGK